jgi:hypothetical protein
MKFFDANVCVGLGTRETPGAVADAAALLAAMDGAGLDRALVWHLAQHDLSPPDGNRLLAEALAGCPRLVGTWALLPPQTGETIVPGFFAAMDAAGVRALRAFPEPHRFLMRRAVFGGFLDEVSDRRIPLLVSLERGFNWPAVYDLLEAYPRLTCVLCDVGIWGQDRNVWPLLEGFERVYAETSLVSLEAGGLEAGVRRFGAGRYLFGSAFPFRYPEAPIMDLLHADLPEEDKRAIAGGNLARLLAEVRL